MDEFEGSSLFLESDLIGSRDYQIVLDQGKFDAVLKNSSSTR